MNTGLTRRGPGYRKLAEDLREQIRSGVLRVGERLPTFAELHDRYGVARATVDKSYSLLNAEGLIDRRPGSGVYVSPQDVLKPISRIGFYFPLQAAKSIEPYWAHIWGGIRSAANELELEVIMLNGAWNASMQRSVNGAIFSMFSPMRARALHSPRFPCVYLLNPVPGRSSVLVDDYGSGWQAVEFLMKHGHRRIAFFGTAGTIIESRIDGYRDALIQAGIVFEDQWVRYLPDHALDNGHAEAGRIGMTAWLEDGWREIGCTALIVMNDTVAIGVIQALQVAGITIPAQLSVMGFDGTEVCQYVYPTLTSVRIPLEEIGRKSVELLSGMLNHTSGRMLTPQIITIPTEIAPGGTVAEALIPQDE